MTPNEQLARQLECEMHDLALLVAEQSLPVPPPEHSNYSNWSRDE